MKGKYTCEWLVISSTELCGKSCLGKYCKIHLARLRKSSGTKPCHQCGKGVNNYLTLCQGCGYHNESSKRWQRRQRDLFAEFTRLAGIEISY